MHHSAQALRHHPLVFVCLAIPSACALRSLLFHGRRYPFFMRVAVPASLALLPLFLGRFCPSRPTLSILHTRCSILSSSLALLAIPSSRSLLSLLQAHCYLFFTRSPRRYRSSQTSGNHTCRLQTLAAFHFCSALQRKTWLGRKWSCPGRRSARRDLVRVGPVGGSGTSRPQPSSPPTRTSENFSDSCVW